VLAFATSRFEPRASVASSGRFETWPMVQLKQLPRARPTQSLSFVARLNADLLTRM